eukprot:5026613-Alexandrium_andersonii.AAC.1
MPQNVSRARRSSSSCISKKKASTQPLSKAAPLLAHPAKASRTMRSQLKPPLAQGCYPRGSLQSDALSSTNPSGG